MKTKIVKSNPFGLTSKGFAFQVLHDMKTQNKSLSVLDFGCRDGDLLIEMYKHKLIDKGVGVDVDKDEVSKTKPFANENLNFFLVNKNQKLNFPDKSFDVITIIGVVEHVYDQVSLLSELKRLVKDSGMIIVAVPGQHFFSFLDMGNFKFRFKRLHKLYYKLFHTEDEYKERYVANSSGMIGDIEAEKSWHEHFSNRSMAALLQRVGGVAVTDVDGYGFFYRVINNIRFFTPKFLKPVMDKFLYVDSLIFKNTELCFIVKKSS